MKEQLAEAKSVAESAERALAEHLRPAFDAVTALYADRLKDVAVKEPWAADKLRALALAQKIAEAVQGHIEANPNDQLKYQQQQAEHRSGLAQLQKLQQAAQVHASRAQQIREDHERAEQEQDAQRLREAMPEWFDETHHADLNNQLTATAKAMGYPEDRLPDADSADLLALRTANQWKEKAEKWDAYQKAKMKPVREAKKKAPIPNKPGSTNTGQTGAADPVKLLYPND